jgi:hypothetical protein
MQTRERLAMMPASHEPFNPKPAVFGKGKQVSV